MNIYETIKEFIPLQYKESPNFNKVLTIAASACNEIGDVLSDIKDVLAIDNSSATQLDLIGKVLVQSRDGMDDEDYRAALKFKIFQNTSTALVKDVIYILSQVTNATKVIYSDNPPACYTIYTDGPLLNSNINYLMDKLSGAGISVIVQASSGETPFIATESVVTRATLTDESGNIITDDNDVPLGVYNEEQYIIESSKANLVYQP